MMIMWDVFFAERSRNVECVLCILVWQLYYYMNENSSSMVLSIVKPE